MSAQSMAALQRASEIKRAAFAEREALVGQPAEVVLAALRDPGDGLASLPLHRLLRAGQNGVPGPIPCFGPARLRKACSRASIPHGRTFHPDMRLRELSPTERDRLATAIAAEAPAAWTDPTTPERSTTR